MKKLLLGMAVLLTVGACTVKVDGTDMVTYKASLTEIKEDLSKEEQDSLSLSIKRIMKDKGYGLLNFADIIKELDGKSADDIFEQGDEAYEKVLEARRVRKEELRVEREKVVADSIAKYDEQGLWELKYFVDEFNEPTKDGYIIQYCDGVFSNSATTDSKLTGKVMITAKGELQVMLLEYGRNKVKSYSSSTKEYRVKIKEDGKDGIVFKGLVGFYSDRLLFTQPEVVNLLKSGKKLKVYIIEASKYSNSAYLFSVDGGNTDKALIKLKK